MTSAIDALSLTMRGCPGGIEAMAPRVGKGVSTFRQELNPPPGSTAKLGLLTFSAAMECAKQVGRPDAFAPLHALAAEHGFALVAMPQMDSDGDTDAMQIVGALMQEFGNTAGDLSEVLRDGKVTGNERDRFNAISLRLIAAVCAAQTFVHLKHEEGKPR